MQRELDVVAIDHEGRVTAVGSCKWTKGPMTRAQIDPLRRMSRHIAPDGAEPDRYLFSRAGFDAALTREAKEDPTCHLVRVADLFQRRGVKT